VEADSFAIARPGFELGRSSSGSMRPMLLKKSVPSCSVRFSWVVLPLTKAHERLVGRSERSKFFACGAATPCSDFFNNIGHEQSFGRAGKQPFERHFHPNIGPSLRAFRPQVIGPAPTRKIDAAFFGAAG
jgi:hypothetical protein